MLITGGMRPFLYSRSSPGSYPKFHTCYSVLILNSKHSFCPGLLGSQSIKLITPAERKIKWKTDDLPVN